MRRKEGDPEKVIKDSKIQLKKEEEQWKDHKFCAHKQKDLPLVPELSSLKSSSVCALLSISLLLANEHFSLVQ